MSLEERSSGAEHFTDLTCATDSLSPYVVNTSAVTGVYGEPLAYYPTAPEYDWQHHAPHLVASDRHCYPYSGEALDLGGQTYYDHGHQTVTHATEYYSSGHGLWASPVSTADSLSPEQHQRFFSTIELGAHGNLQQTSSSSSSSSGKPKRKRVQSFSQRKAANVRERKRMFHLNEAFDELRKRLPAFNYEKRLSRIETLRLAMTYISFMKEVSNGGDPKCVRLKSHGADMSPLSVSSSMYKSGDDHLMHADSDCSNDELSNHSGGH